MVPFSAQMLATQAQVSVRSLFLWVSASAPTTYCRSIPGCSVGGGLRPRPAGLPRRFLKWL